MIKLAAHEEIGFLRSVATGGARYLVDRACVETFSPLIFISRTNSFEFLLFFFSTLQLLRIKIILSNLLKEGYIRSIILPSRNKYIAIVKLKVSFFKLISLN